MKRILFLLTSLFALSEAFGQIGFFDYKHGRKFTIEGITYIVENKLDKANLMELATKGAWIHLENINNWRFDAWGQYTDGSFVEDEDPLGDTRGVIIAHPYYKSYIYSALRKAFTKEELAAHSDFRLIILIVVDNQGNILETAPCFKIHPDYVIQPEQIATLDRELRKNLKFELDTKKASKLNYFQGQIMIFFKHYANFVEAELPGSGLTPVNGRPATQP